MVCESIKYLIASILLMGSVLQAQNDTIHLKSTNVIVGEIKSIQAGILEIETPYSDKDFRIEFNKVRKLIIQRKCFISLTRGRRRFGHVRSDTLDKVTLTLDNGVIEHYNLNEIIGIQEISSSFWNRFKGNIDLSYNFTKTNNDTQFIIGGSLGYMSEKWWFDWNIDVLQSSRDNTTDISRTDVNMQLKRILPRKWYLLGNLSFLENTEQGLNSRINPTIGIGRMMVSTNKLFLGVTIGYAYNVESYVDPTLDKSSSEALIAGSFNMFDVKDFDFKTSLQIYPSLSEKGRVRVDYDISLKYDMPWDFYIKAAFTLNYDNQPAIEGTEIDYIFNSGFGWKFD